MSRAASTLLPHIPPAAAWVEVDGRRWATTGAILIREDHPVPEGTPCEPWMEGLTATRIREHLDADPIIPLEFVGEVRHYDVYRGDFVERLLLGPETRHVMRGLDVRIGASPLVVHGYRDGELMAVAARIDTSDMSRHQLDRVRALLKGEPPEPAPATVTAVDVVTALIGLRYVLERVRTDPDLNYYMGRGTESLTQLCRAVDALSGEDEDDLVEHYGRKAIDEHREQEPEVLRLRRALAGDA